ncbi:MAG: AAA family ATPase [Acidobacteria bacterium]|nr:AAA family ATPase [Acidobacteriota bacterium]
MDILTRDRMGLPPDPWSGLEIGTADAARVAVLVGAAATAGAMVWVLGPRGVGKTRAVREALRRTEPPLVEPLRLDRENLHLGDIQAAIVRDLSDERPRRSGEARSGQVRRILGGQRRTPVLFVDEAHALHHATVRGLKRLRELSWQGRSPLIGVVLAGQRDAAARIAEVALRSDRVTMAGPTREEASRALLGALNARRQVITPEAAARLVDDDRARTWLDLQDLADECMARAVARGAETVDESVAGAVLAPPSIRTAAKRPGRANAAAPSDEAVAARLAEAS